MTKRMLSALVLATLVAAPVLAADQDKPAEAWVVETYAIHVRPDSVLQFESAVKNHMKMHADAGDTSAMHVYMEVIGSHMGTYFLRSAPQHWADFDNAMQIPGDRDDVLSKIVPLTTKTASEMSVFMPDVSNWPKDLPAPKYVEVMDFRIKAGHEREFHSVIKRIHEALQDKAPSRHYEWERTVEGGRGTEVTLAIPHDSWADFKMPDPPMYKILTEVYGETEADMMWKTINEAVDEVESFVVMYRPDLSYNPEMK